MNNQSIGISAIEMVLPDKKMSIEEMANLIGEEACELEKKIGIQQKSVLDHDQDIIDLAVHAVKELLLKNNLNPNKIDLIIHASCGLQDKQLWSPAAKIQKEVKAKNAFSFDIQNGCNSGNLALAIAKRMLVSDDTKQMALIVVADALSQIVDYKNVDHKCIFNFSDAASAILIQKKSSSNILLSFVASTEAIFADSLYKSIDDQYVWLNDDPHEDELLKKVYEDRYTQMINLVLKKINKNIDDVSHIIMNQGDHKLIDKLAARLCYPANRIFRSHQDYGHLGGSDVFFGLNQILKEGLIKSGDLVVLASSAIGFSWGASVIQI